MRGRSTAARTHIAPPACPSPLICEIKAVFIRQKSWLGERNTPKMHTERISLKGDQNFSSMMLRFYIPLGVCIWEQRREGWGLPLLRGNQHRIGSAVLSALSKKWRHKSQTPFLIALLSYKHLSLLLLCPKCWLHCPFTCAQVIPAVIISGDTKTA